MIYRVAAAPFVRLLGMNGFLVFHVLLLFVACVCGYLFLAADSRPAAALTFTLAFVGASVVPVYIVFLTSDLFNFALVFIAYFLWLYKEVARAAVRWLNGTGSEVVAAVLLGMATYSKPTHVPLMAPIVLYLWWRRRFLRGFVVGSVSRSRPRGCFPRQCAQSPASSTIRAATARPSTAQRFPLRRPDSPRDAWDQRDVVTHQRAGRGGRERARARRRSSG